MSEKGQENNNKIDTKEAQLAAAEHARRQYLAEQQLAKFASLYFARASEEQICTALHMSRSTYYRYLKRLAAQQDELLNEHILESTYAEIASFKNTLRFAEIHLRNIVNSKDALFSDKVDALNLLCEVSYAGLKLHTQGTIQTIRELPASVKKKLIDLQPQDLQDVTFELTTSSNNNNKEAKGQQDGTSEGSGSQVGSV